MQSSRIDNSRIMNYTHKPRRNGNGNGNGQYLGPKPITAEEAAKTVYVSNLTNDIAHEAIVEAFSHYGHVDSIVRRCVNFELNAGSGQQYAFIKFVHAKDAQFVINLGDITVQGRKLTVRPRDKPGSPRGRDFRQDEHSTKRIIDMLHNSARSARPGSPHGHDEHPKPSRVSEAFQPVNAQASRVLRPVTADASMYSQPQSQLSSRILMVANVPIDMTPHEFFELFGQYGLIERAYIFPHPDAHGRRFGQVVMFNPFYARKAFEALHGAFIRGPLSLDISFYTQNIPTYPPPVTPQPSSTVLSHFPINGAMFPPIDFGGLSVQVPSVHGASQTLNYAPQLNEQMMFPVQQGHIVAIPSHPSYASQATLQHYPSKEHLATQGGWGIGQMAAPYVGHYQPEFGHGELVYDTPETLALNSHISDSRVFSGASTATLVGNVDNSMKKMAYEEEYPEESPTVMTAPVEATYSLSEHKELSEPQKIHEERSTGCGGNAPTFTETTTVTDELETQIIPETPRPYDPANLHVKNLDDSRITNTEDLKNLFAGYGQIASAVLVTYPNSGISKGFGFVAFTTPADAAKAKASLNGMLVGRKPIVINYAERKEDRRQRLKAIFDSRTGPKSGLASDVHFPPDTTLNEHHSGESVPTITISGITERESEIASNITEEEQKRRTELKTDSSSSERASGSEATVTGKEAPHLRDMVGSPISDLTLEEGPRTSEDITSLVNSGPCRAASSVIRSNGTEPRLQVAPVQTEQRFTVTTTVTTTKAWHGGRITQLDDDSDKNISRPSIQQARNGSYNEQHNQKTGIQARPKHVQSSSYSKQSSSKNVETYQPTTDFSNTIGLPSSYATGPTTIQLSSPQTNIPQSSPSQNPVLSQKPIYPAAGQQTQRIPVGFGGRIQSKGNEDSWSQQHIDQQLQSSYGQSQPYYIGNIVQSYPQRNDANMNMDPNIGFSGSQRGRKWRPASGGFRRKPDYNQMRPIVEDQQQWNKDSKKPKRKKSYTRQQVGGYYGEGNHDPLAAQYNNERQSVDMGEHSGKPAVPVIKVEIPQ